MSYTPFIRDNFICNSGLKNVVENMELESNCSGSDEKQRRLFRIKCTVNTAEIENMFCVLVLNRLIGNINQTPNQMKVKGNLYQNNFFTYDYLSLSSGGSG